VSLNDSAVLQVHEGDFMPVFDVLIDNQVAVLSKYSKIGLEGR